MGKLPITNWMNRQIFAPSKIVVKGLFKHVAGGILIEFLQLDDKS